MDRREFLALAPATLVAARAGAGRPKRIRAVAFYGFPSAGRARQFEYAWLRTLGRRYVDSGP